MEGEGEGAGNRGGGHGQQVGLEALGKQAVALAHPKAVLFIDHHQPQAVELDRIFQEGVGSHQELQLTVHQIPKQLAPPLGRR